MKNFILQRKIKGIKLNNLYLGIIEQGPFKRAWRNFVVTRNAWGMFSKNSHRRADTGKLKVMYNTKASAQKQLILWVRKWGNTSPFTNVYSVMGIT